MSDWLAERYSLDHSRSLDFLEPVDGFVEDGEAEQGRYEEQEGSSHNETAEAGDW
jgi:hypothetical protein